MMNTTDLTISNFKIPIIAGAILLTLYGLRQQHHHQATNEKKEIPKPKGLPLFGNLLSLGSSPFLQFFKWKETLGPIFKLDMGQQKWIIINDPFIAQDLFHTNGMYTSGKPGGTFGHDIYARQGRGLVFASNTKKWRDTKAAVNTMLSQKGIDEYMNVIVYETEELLNRFAELKGENVNPKDDFQLVSYNVIMNSCFAKRAPNKDDYSFKKITEMLHIQNKNAAAMEYIGSFLPWLAWLDVLTQKKKKLIHHTYIYRDIIFNALIKEARDHGKECMVNKLYSMIDEYQLDDSDILVTMSDLIVAGSDTVFVTLLWATAIMANHPEVQKAICNEIDEFLKVNQCYPAISEYNQFPHLMSCIKECMRYRSSVPFLVPRMVTEDFEYNDYQFHKGDILLGDVNTMNKTSPSYDHHNTFIADRYIDDQKSMSASANGNIQSRDHYNFGFGRRICPGIYLAETEMFIIWTRLFSRFTIEPAIDENENLVKPNIETVVDGGIILEPENYQVRFIERESFLFK
ncbi:unnamed protein product [Cunninghamella blakesleeana]